jgi:hypothetical protein
MEEREKLNIEYRWRFLKTFIFMHICVRAHLFVLILFATYVLLSNYCINKRRLFKKVILYILFSNFEIQKNSFLKKEN